MAERDSTGVCRGEDENERRELGRKPAAGPSTAHFQTGRGCAHMHLRWTQALSRDSSTVGKVGLHVLMSLTMQGQCLILQQGRIRRGTEHTKIT